MRVVNLSLSLLSKTYAAWSNDKAQRLCAALSYYTLFAIAPFLIIAIGVASVVLGDNAPADILNTLEQFIGKNAAATVTSMIKAQEMGQGGFWATLIGSGLLLFGVLRLFGNLQDSLNTIWGVTPKPRQGWKGLLRARVTSFTTLFVTYAFLIVSVISGTVISAFGERISHLISFPSWVLQFANTSVFFLLLTLLFGLVFKLLPDAKIAWRDVWIGAGLTSLLFAAGKLALSLYLGRASVSSSYGAAGSGVVVLLWIYYSAQIFFVGAEFTKVYANTYGSRVSPADYAVSTSSLGCRKMDLTKKKRVKRRLYSYRTKHAPVH